MENRKIAKEEELIILIIIYNVISKKNINL